MLPIANKSTKDINRFVRIPIPSPRDLYNRYGARTGTDGIYLSSPEEVSDVGSGRTTIAQMIHAQKLSEKEFTKSNPVDSPSRVAG